MKHALYILFGFWLVLLGMASGPEVRAQDAPTLDPSKAITQYVHEVWQVEDGLPQNSVFSILQTRDGYLWIGTEEGLARFDGVRFTVFDKRTEEAFRVNDVSVLFEDRQGTLWAGTREGGLLAYAEGQFTGYTTADGLSSNVVTALREDRDGTLWIGTYGGGLVRYRAGQFTVLGEEAGFVGEIVNALYEDAAHTLWVGTDAGLFHVRQGQLVLHPEERLATAFVTAIFEDRAGALWVGAYDGMLYRVQDGRVVEAWDAETLPEGYVTTFFQDDAGSLWIGMKNGGLVRYRAGAFSAFTEAEGLTHNDVKALYQDREGSLWIGTIGGLNRLRDGAFTPYTVHESLAPGAAFSIYEHPDGSLWVGTEGGLSRLHDGQMTTYTTDDGLSSNDIIALYGDPNDDGALWISTESSLERLQNGTFTNVTTELGLPGVVVVLYADSQGTLWFGTDAGVGRFDGEQVHMIGAEDGLSSDFISALYESHDGALWMGTYDAGVNRVKDGAITTYTTDDGLSNDGVLALYEDADGTLWIGTYGGGLNRLKDGRITAYTTREGLFNDNVFTILEDDSGFLWMTCNKGVFRVSKQELDAFATGTRTQITSIAYGKIDGLKSEEGTGGQQPVAWKSHDGRLWFATTNGVVTVDPANLQHNALAPPVVIERLVVGAEPVAMSASVMLPPGGKNLEIDYTALSLAVPERVRFKYKLEGLDEDWFDAGSRREAYFTNLDPGPYTFHVIAANEDGVWNETGASLSFYLNPYFYQTTWFLVLCVFGLLVFAFTGYRLRINQLKARERQLERVVDERTHDLRLEKERTEQAKEVIEAQAEKLIELDRFKTRFFANVSHEFRTPLTMIVGPLENALHGSYGDVEGTMKRQMEIMLRNALRLMRLINQLLDLSKLEAGKMNLKARPRNIAAFLEGVVLTCTALAEQKNLALTFHANSEDIELYYEPDKLEKVFFNLLSNALKHTPTGGAIVASIAEQPASETMPEGAVEIRLRDTGKGIPDADLPYIFDRFRQVDGSNTREHEGTGIGLALVKELVLLHRGAIKVVSEVGVGSEFIVVLPKGKAHLDHEEVVFDQAEDEGFEIEHGPMLELSADLSIMREEVEVSPAENRPATAPDDAPLVLLVDDNADVRDYIGSILGETYRVAMAEDGQEGLEQAHRLKPDLIISDVMMPRMDGNEFCRRVKIDPTLRFMPVILLTARATHELKLEGLEQGADDYMAKPFNARELKARARNLIQLYQQERQLRHLNAHLEQKVQEQLEILLQERTRYEHELIASKEKAEESDRLKSAILDNMSHEFRTPLSSILGYAEIFAAEAPEPLKEFAAEIDQSGHRLMKTLDALMELSKLEADDVGSHLEALDLAQEVGHMVKQYQSVAEKKGLTLHLQPPAQAMAPAHLDASALRRIVSNLLNNALKFTNEGTVSVEVGPADEHVYLRVRDTGIGIDAAFLPRLYDAFTQESDGLTRSYEGCGLGLTIAKRLTDLMGGSIAVETEQGKGSVFTVSFPQTPQQDREARPGATGKQRIRQAFPKGSRA